MNFLKGYRTYIIAAGAIITAVGAYLNGSASLTELIGAIFASLTAMSMRAGVKNDTQDAAKKIVNTVSIALVAGLLLFSFKGCAWLAQQPASTQAAVANMQTAIAQQAQHIADNTLNAVATGKNSQEIKNALVQSSGDALRSLEGAATAQVSGAVIASQLQKWVPPTSPWWNYASSLGALAQTYLNAHPNNPQWANTVLEAVAGALNTHRT